MDIRFHLPSLLRGLLLCMLLAAGPGVAAEGEVPHAVELRLVSRAVNDGIRPALTAEQWRWVREKQALVVGVAPPSTAPVEMINADTYYEGVTADVLGAVGNMLSIAIRVERYPNRGAALEALVDGRIDLVGSANRYEVAERRLALTQSYMRDDPVLYVRRSESRVFPASLSGMRIAMTDGYLPRKVVQKMFGGARIELYDSHEKALSAMAFGRADLYLGDAVSSNYLVNLSYFDHVRIYQVLDVSTGGFGFVVQEDAKDLHSILDAALTAARGQNSSGILKRWSGGGAAASPRRIVMTPAEQRWMERNPVVRFAASNDTAPLSYFDADGRFSGISADVLKAISARTGLEFRQARESHIGGQLNALERGRADVTLLIPTLEREQKLHFSRPFVHAAFAIITRDDPGQPDDAIALRGKRIALPAGHALRELLQPAWAYRFVESRNVAESLEMVADGRADATMTLLPVADYYTSSVHGGKLKVAGIVEGVQAALSIATRKGDTELASILEKALLQIPPDEIDIFQNRWRPTSEVATAAWVDYRGLILKVGGIAFVLILVSLIWNLHIRKQYKRRQQAEEALNDQLSFMESLINGTPHPIYVRDTEGRMLTCNSNYLEVFGATRESVIGRNSLQGVKLDQDEARQFHGDYLRVIQSGRPLEIDRTLHLPGRILSIYHWIHPYCDSQGQVKGVICGWIDVSERRQLLEDLRAARDLADASSRAKTTFLATMSHEIRTPMSAVIGMLELALKHAEQGRFDKAAVEVAHDSARSLLELIGDILDVVRIESGRASLSPQRANLRELVEAVVRVFDGLARQKVLTLALEMDPLLDCDVLVDPLRFKQVLSNLVGNAIKFTDSGEVRIIIEAKPLADNRLLVQLRVEDTGIGIAEDELEGLFEPFAQASHGRTTRGGTGLGLPICKSLCELMGGHIAVSSRVGKGTCVTAEVPLNVLPALAANADSAPATDSAPVPVKMRVLVVDDQQANRVLLAQQLGYFGQLVHSAENGEEGLRLWREHPIDVVITDCNMPVMNGYDMARAIRSEEDETGIPPCAIIGFTANAQPEEKARCVAAGMDDCLFKPVSLKALSAMLVKLSGMPNVVRQPSPPAEASPVSIEDALYELTGGDPGMTRLLVDEACLNYVADRAELQVLRQTMDTDVLGRLAHRIKGGARIFQQQAIMAACSRLEQACEEAPDETAAILADVEVIDGELGELVSRLEAYLEEMAAAG